MGKKRLLVDIGSIFTKIVAIDLEQEIVLTEKWSSRQAKTLEHVFQFAINSRCLSGKASSRIERRHCDPAVEVEYRALLAG